MGNGPGDVDWLHSLELRADFADYLRDAIAESRGRHQRQISSTVDADGTTLVELATSAESMGIALQIVEAVA